MALRGALTLYAGLPLCHLSRLLRLSEAQMPQGLPVFPHCSLDISWETTLKLPASDA